MSDSKICDWCEGDGWIKLLRRDSKDPVMLVCPNPNCDCGTTNTSQVLPAPHHTVAGIDASVSFEWWVGENKVSLWLDPVEGSCVIFTPKHGHQELEESGRGIVAKLVKWLKPLIQCPSEAWSDVWECEICGKRFETKHPEGQWCAEGHEAKLVSKRLRAHEVPIEFRPRMDKAPPCAECVALKAEIARRDENRALSDIRRAANRAERKVRVAAAKAAKRAQWKDLEKQRDDARRLIAEAVNGECRCACCERVRGVFMPIPRTETAQPAEKT
jgi:hypothetical protein